MNTNTDSNKKRIIKEKKYWPLWLVMFLWLLVIGVVGSVLVIYFGEKNWFTALAYLVAASAITAGGCVAHRHLTIIQGTERAKVITSLDTCWSGAELSQSRADFLKFRNELINKEGSPERREEAKKKLSTMKTSNHDIFTRIHNMVDFYETLGYFSRVRYILPEDAIQLYGPSIRQYNEVFREYILGRQANEHDNTIYENFLWLADESSKAVNAVD